MTTVLEPLQKHGSTLMGHSLPQVNLLPPEIRAARSLRVLKRWLGIGLVVTVLATAGVYALAARSVTTAAAEQTAAQSETVRIQGQQRKYAEVPKVLTTLESAKTARTLAMSTEVTWKGSLDAIKAVLPAGVSIETLAVTGATPMTAATVPVNPLQGPSVGLITFTGKTATLPDTAAWIDALNSIPGFADAWVSAATLTKTDTTNEYTVASTVQFTTAAYARRFAAADGSK